MTVDRDGDSKPHPESASPVLLHVLESAARLQQLVPDAVLVGGSAAALYAGHRVSFDHDHVLSDLDERFKIVLDAVESDPSWVIPRIRPGKVILGELGGIETGIRQLIRRTPLETTEITLQSSATLIVPTAAETLRVKGSLIVRRNQERDYLDVVALAARYGIASAAGILGDLDRYYADQRASEDGVASQLVRQLADPRPKDSATTTELPRYKELRPPWQSWSEVVRATRALADAMVLVPEEGQVQMTAPPFRNVETAPDTPVEFWPFEAVLTAIERSGLKIWRDIATELRRDPWGPTSRKVEQALTVTDSYGITEVFADVLATARATRESEERTTVAAEIRQSIADSGLSRTEFASRIGTSASRLSTYENGRVVPSATMMLRIRRMA